MELLKEGIHLVRPSPIRNTEQKCCSLLSNQELGTFAELWGPTSIDEKRVRCVCTHEVALQRSKPSHMAKKSVKLPVPNSQIAIDNNLGGDAKPQNRLNKPPRLDITPSCHRDNCAMLNALLLTCPQMVTAFVILIHLQLRKLVFETRTCKNACPSNSLHLIQISELGYTTGLDPQHK